MKTAMQELIDIMTDKKRRMLLSLDLGLFRKSAYSQLIRPSQIDAIGDAIKLAQSMLEKEKEQIIDANIAGMEFIAVDPNRHQEDAEQYYNETFKTNEK
jgi:hypothetical protein